MRSQLIFVILISDFMLIALKVMNDAEKNRVSRNGMPSINHDERRSRIFTRLMFPAMSGSAERAQISGIRFWIWAVQVDCNPATFSVDFSKIGGSTLHADKQTAEWLKEFIGCNWLPAARYLTLETKAKTNTLERWWNEDCDKNNADVFREN